MPKQETPRLDLICILALSVEWIGFGSSHFALHQLAEVEIPPFIPYQAFIIIVTGMAEVTTGILILLPRTRKWAAITSLVLLFLFLPSIYYMLAADAALPFAAYFRNFVRVLLVPNHVLLALCAIHLWQEQSTIVLSQALEIFLSPSQESTDARSGSSSRRARESAGQVSTVIVAIVMLLANGAGLLAVLFPLFLSPPWHFATVFLWGLMCIATGELVGFLFAVPRVNLDKERSITHRPNSNIEVVSDWLTKIIVGVGLVEFHNIGTFLRGMSAELGRSLATQPSAQSEAEATSFALGLIVYFFVIGIIQGYLLTRMYLSRQFQEHEAPVS
jgi:uncharacterized membrane protein